MQLCKQTQGIHTHRAGARAAGAVQDPTASLGLVPHGLELPTGGRAGADAMSGHRVAVLVDAGGRVAVLLALEMRHRFTDCLLR